ncbi:MAG: ArnT family glycosyltransferase [Vicinamibacterales bacterium]
MILTLLVLNVCRALIVGASNVPGLGPFGHLPGLGASALLLAIWTGGRAALRHRTAVREWLGRPWIRDHAPEIVLAVLFAVGLAMRLWAIDFGRPLILHPDEPVAAGVAIQMLKAGSLAAPVPYHYPTVYMYLVLPAFALRYVRGKSAGLWSSLDDVDLNTFEFYEVARAHSAVLGALTIVLTFMLARRMWPGRSGRWAGAAAAAFVALSFNHVKESHFAVTDAALTFFVVLAFLSILRAMQRGSAGSYALAGFASGIACATKYSALPIVVVLVVAHLFGGIDAVKSWRRLAAGLAGVVAGFFAGYPYALLNWPPFLEHLGWMSRFAGDSAYSPAGRFSYLVGYSMESGFGFLFTLVLGAALLLAVHRRRPGELLAVTFIVVSLSLLAKTSHPFYPRYLLPLLPFAAVLVAHLVVEMVPRVLRTERSRRFVPACTTMLVGILVWPTATEAVGYVKYLGLDDTRVETHDFIIQRFPPGSTIVSEVPYLSLPSGYTHILTTPLQRNGADEYIRMGAAALVFSSDMDRTRGNSNAADMRRGLKEHFPLAAAFRPGRDRSVGPTISIHVPPQQ